jgi:hypothetical protein
MGKKLVRSPSEPISGIVCACVPIIPAIWKAVGRSITAPRQNCETLCEKETKKGLGSQVK